MRKGQTVDYEHPVIKHIMLDGRVDSIEGVVIPAGHEFYFALLEVAERRIRERNAKESK